jgi:multidrug resistance efflux pump
MTAGTDRLAAAVEAVERALEMLRKEQFERASSDGPSVKNSGDRIAHALRLLETAQRELESSDVSAPANTSAGTLDPESSLGRL